ncbi:MAG: hypothetical protein IJU37_11905 [Desulfovibrio sp.]|nr:hypothetical protein [Desulfovibrio sp.]
MQTVAIGNSNVTTRTLEERVLEVVAAYAGKGGTQPHEIVALYEELLKKVLECRKSNNL